MLFKDPFSERTLIPNFEPFPDALYYVSSARNFLMGQGLVVGRENRNFNAPIPPLYSLSFVPAYIINIDPRMFYFSNVVMSLISFLIFYRILILLKINKLISSFLLFLYVSNYFLYWLPTIAMAENLTIPLFLGSVLLLLSKTSPLNTVLFAFLGVGLYATKYASIPLTATFLTAYFLKLYIEWRSKKINLKYIYIFILSVIIFSAAFFTYEEITKGTSPVHSLKIFITSLGKETSVKNLPVVVSSTDIVSSSSATPTAYIPSMATPAATPVSSSDPWFSFDYIKFNIGHYFNSITGGSERFLWDYTPLVPKLIGIGGILGILLGLFIKRLRILSAVLAVTLFGSILFMSTLYTYDMRYIVTAIPSLILGFGILLNEIFRRYKLKLLGSGLIFLIVLASIFYGATNFIRIKSQISLNLRYAETPWYYVSILKMNEYFTKDKIIQNKKPVVISALPPYLVDFFDNSNYTLLPLSYDQEFRNIKEVVWGSNDYSNLPKLYEKYLIEGYDVYVERYGLGNESYTNRDYDTIFFLFNTKLVFSGCYEQCNIYKISLKE